MMLDWVGGLFIILLIKYLVNFAYSLISGILSGNVNIVRLAKN